MNKTELNALFDTWKPRLGLDLWSIEISVEAFDEETDAMECSQSRDYNEARIKVQPWILSNKPPENWHAGKKSISDFEIEKYVVHELLHCVAKRTKEWQFTLNGQLHRDLWDVAIRAAAQAEEFTVDALATALVKTWPS